MNYKRTQAKVTANKATYLDCYLPKCKILLVTKTVRLYAKMTF